MSAQPPPDRGTEREVVYTEEPPPRQGPGAGLVVAIVGIIILLVLGYFLIAGLGPTTGEEAADEPQEEEETDIDADIDVDIGDGNGNGNGAPNGDTDAENDGEDGDG